MFYAYVLSSIRFNYYYKGHCSNLQKRLKEHNSGMTQSTRPFIPFEIVYFEEFHSEDEAVRTEKYWKTSAG